MAKMAENGWNRELMDYNAAAAQFKVVNISF